MRNPIKKNYVIQRIVLAALKQISVLEFKSKYFCLLTILFYCSIWGLLSGANCGNASGVVQHDLREIESWILSLISCPVPGPGKTKVTLELLPTVMQVC